MAATTLPGAYMPSMTAQSLGITDLLTQVRKDHPGLSFEESSQFSWHAKSKRITFKKPTGSSEKAVWALLHELGHALLGHADYRYDIELIQLEAAAWTKSRELAAKYGVDIDEDYIQDCLDTYRDWLHLRATCPTCFARSLQASPCHYRCFNCRSEWSVSRSRFCRPYRLQKAVATN